MTGSIRTTSRIWRRVKHYNVNPDKTLTVTLQCTHTIQSKVHRGEAVICRQCERLVNRTVEALPKRPFANMIPDDQVNAIRRKVLITLMGEKLIGG